MQASRQLFWDKLNISSSIKNLKTTELIENGSLCYFTDVSAPFYLPIGQLFLDKIISVIEDEAYNIGINKITIPILVNNEMLRSGEPIKEGFERQIMQLMKPLDDFHLLFTPEPIIIHLSRVNLLSYRQLPIRLCFISDVFRAINDTKGVLKSREFLTFMGISIDPDRPAVDESIKLFGSLTTKILNKLKIPFVKCKREFGINEEYYYFGSEGETIFVPEIDSGHKLNCLSLAMAYQYCPTKTIKARFRNSSNSKQAISMTTFGLGIQRVFYAALDACRDALGFNTPELIQPFKFAIIPKKKVDTDKAFSIYQFINRNIERCFLDDRFQYSSGIRSAFSDFIGIPVKIILDDTALLFKKRGIGQVFKKGHINDNLTDILSGY